MFSLSLVRIFFFSYRDRATLRTPTNKTRVHRRYVPPSALKWTSLDPRRYSKIVFSLRNIIRLLLNNNVARFSIKGTQHVFCIAVIADGAAQSVCPRNSLAPLRLTNATAKYRTESLLRRYHVLVRFLETLAQESSDL
ncbi:hypothetical protein FPOAC2_14511 [Fusarium poae]|jgi:hypothetical protein